MGEMTESSPKCMVELGGLRLIEWQISSLIAAGITDISLVAGYKGQMLEAFELPIDLNEDWKDTNMVYSLKKARERLCNSTSIISYSDIVFHPGIVKSLMESSGDIVITYDRLWHDLWSIRFENPLEDAESFRQEEGELREIGGSNPQLNEVSGQYMGLLLITPKGWIQIEELLDSKIPEEVEKMDMTTLLRNLLEKGIEIEAIGINGRWCEVDSEKDRFEYEKRLDGGPLWTHDWRW